MHCVACGSCRWQALPDPAPGRSVSTAGIIVPQRLGKSQCMSCGLVARTVGEFLGTSGYYEEEYASYYQRPGASVFDTHRYAAMASWMKSALADFQPRSILDVGCGAGWSMDAVSKVFSGAVVEGIEPSKENSKLAQQRGLKVWPVRLEGFAETRKRYDLIYSYNVLTHVTAPTDFLAGLRDLLADGGRIIQITVDATKPSNEMLWLDHNFSFLPLHLKQLAERVSLTELVFSPNPDDASLLCKQLAMFAKADEGGSLSEPALDVPDVDRL